MHRFVVVFSLLFFVHSSVQGEAYDAPEKLNNVVWNGVIGANILASFVGNGSSENRIALVAGGNGQFFFSPNVGFFVGGELVSRGLGSGSATSFFLDVPFGMAFRYGSRMFSSTTRSYFNLGGFFSVPLGNLGNRSTKNALGIAIQSGTLFPVTEGFNMGFGSWAKYGVTESLAGTGPDKILEIGIGFLLNFG